MKKIVTIIAFAFVLASCNQKTEPTATPTNTGSYQVETRKVGETPKTSEQKTTKNTEKTDDFEIDLPENFTITKENDVYFIAKKGTHLTSESYFSISKYTKEEQEQMKKCQSVKVPQTFEELNKMTEQEKKDYEPCQGPAMLTDANDLPVIHITEKGDFWLVRGGHELPIGEENAESYAKTLKLFGVTEKITDEHGSTNLVPNQLIQYFKQNTRFKK